MTSGAERFLSQAAFCAELFPTPGRLLYRAVSDAGLLLY